MYVGIGGFFRAHLTFPKEYPLLPPKMVFKSPIFHPNSKSLDLLSSGRDRCSTDFGAVYSSGEVCISSISHLGPFPCLHSTYDIPQYCIHQKKTNMVTSRQRSDGHLYKRPRRSC